MLYVFSDDYPKFQCVAGDCEETCCGGWQIVVDEQSLKKYRAEKGPYRKTLRRSIHWKEKVFRQDKEKRCAFLREDNLCELYRQLGAKSLCRTCRLYPRHIEEFENVREISLSVSCPEAARLLLYRREPVKFLEFEREQEETYETFDELLYGQLTEGRSRMIRILQERSLPLRLRIGLVSGLANDMQKAWNEGSMFEIQELFGRIEEELSLVDAQADGADSFDAKHTSLKLLALTERKMQRSKAEEAAWGKELLEELERLEYLKEEWPLWLMEVKDWLYQGGWKEYEKISREFDTWLKAQEEDWQIPFENLCVYYLFAYFCGAVYDGEILSSAQLGIGYCWILREMLMATWIRNEKALELEDLKNLVVRLSREVEHSDRNQKQMETFMAKKRLPWLKRKEKR